MSLYTKGVSSHGDAGPQWKSIASFVLQNYINLHYCSYKLPTGYNKCRIGHNLLFIIHNQ